MTNPTVAQEVSESEWSTLVDVVVRTLKDGNPGVALTGGGLDQDTLQREVRKAAEQALSLSIFDVCLKAWYGARTIRKLTGEDGPLDGKTRTVGLAEHDLKARHVPTLHFTVGSSIDVSALGLPIVLTGKVRAVSLRIRDRRIIGVAGGSLTMRLALYVEKVKVIERELTTYELAGIEFETRDDAVG